MKENKTYKKVMIGTPSLDGKLEAWYVNSLLETIKLCSIKDIMIFPIFLCYDSLLPKVRNDIFAIAYESQVDDLIWIDADMSWDPEDFLKLLNHDEDFIGGTARRKTDIEESYVIKIKDGLIRNEKTGLIEVSGIGLAFTKMSKKCIDLLWDSSEKYNFNNKIVKNIFEIKIKNEEFISEDINVCNKWNLLNEKIWFDPSITISHIGTKIFKGNFLVWAESNNLLNKKLLLT